MHILKYFCVLLCFILLSGCSNDALSTLMKSFTTFKTSSVWLKSVSFKVADKVNDSSPVKIHIVIIYTNDLLQNLSKMTSQEYFSKATQIKLDNSERMDVFEWELVRSETRHDEPVKPNKYSGEGILVFAQYTTPGVHRASIGEDENVLITLNDEDFTVSSLNK
jgi:type VI secretion system protein